MKLTNTTLLILCATVVILVGFVVMLMAMGKDATQIVAFLGTTLIPTVVGLFAVQRSDQAKKNSEQAVINTNGRMSHLVSIIEALGGSVPPAYADIPRLHGADAVVYPSAPRTLTVPPLPVDPAALPSAL